jgi:hypothetical protein
MRRALILAACLAAGAAGAFDASPLLQFVTAQSFTPLTLGPVAWYKFESNVLDSVSTNNGTWAGGGGTYTNGLNGQCANFSQNTTGLRYISCNAPLIAITNWTVVAWLYMAATNVTMFPIAQYTAGQTGRFNTRIDPIIKGQFGGAEYASSATMPPAAWTHVVWGCNNGSNGVFYVNGVAAGTVSYAANRVTQLSVTTIGGMGASSAQSPYTQLIDDVLIFPRALTQSEITQLYNWRQ